MDCIFCKIVEGSAPSKKIYEDDIVIAIMDIDPFCDGHVLIIPKKHYDDIFNLDIDILKHINEVSKILIKKIMNNLNKNSMTVSYNYGKKQIVKHFHMHLLPNIDDGVSEDIDSLYNKIMNIN